MTSIDINQVVSMFQIPESTRLALADLAESQKAESGKKSINTCILEALEYYLGLPQTLQKEPTAPQRPLRAFTVRMPAALKETLTITAARWQIKTSMPVSMNAVLNTAIDLYLERNEK